MKFKMTSFGRWIIAMSAMCTATGLRYGAVPAVLAGLLVTAAWMTIGEVKK